MSELEIFYVAIAVWGIFSGVNHFVGDATLTTVAAVAAIVTGVVALVLVF
jgi:hypothetical protein